MEFTFSIDNLFQPGFNALAFSCIAMGIVFSVLTLISIYVALLPKVLNLFTTSNLKGHISKRKGLVNESKLKVETVEDDEQDMLLAVATAIHLEYDSMDGDVKFIDSGDHKQSAWAAAGRAHSLRGRRVLR